MSESFDDVPATPRGHLGLLFYEAAFAVIAHVHARAARAGNGLAKIFADFPALEAYLAELRGRMPDGAGWHDGAAWLRARIDEWESRADASLPLIAVRRELGLTRDARLTLAILGLVEEEAAFASLFAALQAPLDHRRPTIGLLRELAREAYVAEPDPWPACGALLATGLADVLNADAPRSEWALRVPAPVWSAISGERRAAPSPGLRYQTPDAFTPLRDLILPDAQLARVVELCALVEARQARTVVVRGPAGCDRLEVIGAVARELNQGALEVSGTPAAHDERLRLLGPLCTLMRAVPVFSLELGPSETFTVPELPGYAGPIALMLGREGGLAGAIQAVTLQMYPDAPAMRLRHWQRAAADQRVADLQPIAERFAISGRYIRQVAPLAKACAALERRTVVQAADVRQASRAVNRQALDALATPLEPGGGWDQLVLGPGTEMDLRDLERRCRHRERLSASMGPAFPGGLNRGVRALFEGPSGTGKTLAARVLAAEIGLDLYRVDLASVVNKYIGETEKNLSRILSRAEDLDVILLLDEGDALLSRRTEVRSSNDRYANLETNYLLQRLETYDGIAIVTTNLGAQIDPAFRRRMDVVARFHLPDAEQRWRLWQIHLRREHQVDAASL